ncbi:MAG: hypothetical protein HC765_14370 [Brachymonas sp.]|nr:hypothetical protein [Brachymonas sp.]
MGLRGLCDHVSGLGGVQASVGELVPSPSHWGVKKRRLAKGQIKQAPQLQAHHVADLRQVLSNQ